MTINIPTPLRAYTDGKSTAEAEGATVAAALHGLCNSYPSLQKNLYGSDGKLRSFVNVYLNEEDIRYLPEGEATATKPGDELSIIPSIAGGC